MSLFEDRADAGRRLAAALDSERGSDVVVLALPRGGVAVAVEVARHLRVPLDLIMVRKLGAPGQPELAVGAVVDGETPFRVINADVVRMLGIHESFLCAEEQRQLGEIRRRRQLYLGHVRHVPLHGRTVVIVDDGIATGATVRAALHAVRQAGAARTIIAVPVASADTAAELDREADNVVCPVSRDEVVLLVGDVDELRLARILACGATLQQIERAVRWWRGESDVMGEARDILSGPEGDSYELLTCTDEALAEER